MGFNATDGDDKRWAIPGTGTDFNVRIGPDYKKNGQKAPSAPHVYDLVAADVIRNDKIMYHVSERVTLPPPTDPEVENSTGLPRIFVVSLCVPSEAPSLFNSSLDGPGYQIVMYFRATVAKLKAWQSTGCPSVRLWERWVRNQSSDMELKERLKLLIRMENLKELGLDGMLSKYNGKPALITKSGAVFQGADYLEVGMNTHRFAYITKVGMNRYLPKINELWMHCAVTIEGRDNDELPEQCLLAGRIRGLEITKCLLKNYD